MKPRFNDGNFVNVSFVFYLNDFSGRIFMNERLFDISYTILTISSVITIIQFLINDLFRYFNI